MGRRAVLVTGGTRGLGRGLAEAYLAEGADVAICGRRPPEQPVAAGGGEAMFLPADVREPEQAAALVEAVAERFGRLDVVINNAGGSPTADAATASPRFSIAVITLNLLAPLHIAQRANAVMQQQTEGGAIINIGSVSGQRPSPGTAAYGAAKAGLLGLTRSLAVEWAPMVRVNHVTVGLLRTESVDAQYGDPATAAAVAATVPMGRLAEPADVAAACLFLSSPQARYLSGADLAVHGGGEPPVFLTATRTTQPG